MGSFSDAFHSLWTIPLPAQRSPDDVGRQRYRPQRVECIGELSRTLDSNLDYAGFRGPPAVVPTNRIRACREARTFPVTRGTAGKRTGAGNNHQSGRAIVRNGTRPRRIHKTYVASRPAGLDPGWAR